MYAGCRTGGPLRATYTRCGFGWPPMPYETENLQHTGAYKVRGALNALAMQVGRGDRRPVVAASAGNHSAGMAYAARCLGLRAIAVVPESAPQSKIQRTEQLGAQVIVRGAGFEEAQEYAQSLARREGARFLPAFVTPM